MALSGDARLRKIGTHAADMVEDGMLVGLGTGSTAAAMIQALGERAQSGLRVTGVATSAATSNQASALGIPLRSLDDIDRLDLCIDGADEIDPSLNLVKGAGGALLIEKLVALRANHYIIISADEKLVTSLGQRMPLPVEVVPIGWNHTAEAISALGMKPVLRRDADDRPYRTDGQHYILDCGWDAVAIDARTLAHDLKALTGVVEHGLFIDMAHTIVTIDSAGDITEIHR